VNLGISCVSGGVHGRNEFSWVVHYGKFAVKHCALWKKILKLLEKMLDDSYEVHWCKQAKVYCEQLTTVTLARKGKLVAPFSLGCVVDFGNLRECYAPRQQCCWPDISLQHQ
jgi:hypothetical protein